MKRLSPTMALARALWTRDAKLFGAELDESKLNGTYRLESYIIQRELRNLGYTLTPIASPTKKRKAARRG